METTLKTVMASTMQQEGAFAVPARRLTDYLKSSRSATYILWPRQYHGDYLINGESKIPASMHDYPQLPALGETHDTLDILQKLYLTASTTQYMLPQRKNYVP